MKRPATLRQWFARRKITKRPEQALQKAVATYLDMTLPADAVFWHTPNGGYRTPVEAAAFKAMGVRPGIPDICILWLGRLYCIELKAPGGSATGNQTSMHARLQSAGASVSICRTLGEVAGMLTVWGIPSRAAA